MQSAVDAAPFRLGPERAAAGVLLIHGFTGSPFEMRLCGEWLATYGLAVEGPLLPGHGSTTRALAATGWRDWIAGVERAFEALRERAARVAVCGLSLGGLLALELTRRRPSEIAAIALLSTALWLPRPADFVDGILRRLPFVQRAALPKLAGSDILDPEMKRRNGIAQGRAAMPLSSLHSLIEFGHLTRARLGEIRAPALVAHGKHDHTVPFACLDALIGGLGSPEVKRLALERSFHVITLDVEREQVFRAVAEHFLPHLEG